MAHKIASIYRLQLPFLGLSSLQELMSRKTFIPVNDAIPLKDRMEWIEVDSGQGCL